MKSRANSKHESGAACAGGVTMTNARQAGAAPGVLYVGIDVAKDKLDVFADGLFEGVVENTKKGVGRLVRTIRKAAGRQAEVRFAIESTGNYGLFVQLELERLHQKVCVLNPFRVRHYAMGRGVLAKTDRIDARIIRLYAVESGCEPTPAPTQARLALRDLIRTRGLLVKVRTMIQTFLKLPLLGRTSRTVLGEVVRFVQTRIARLDREITAVMKDDPRIDQVAGALENIPGVGAVTATTIATLVPELGTLGRSQAAALAGLAPIPRESGKFKGARTIGGGRADVRRALYMAAFVAKRWDPELKAVYDRLVSKGKKSKVALVACMRKMFIHMDRVVARLDADTQEHAS